MIGVALTQRVELVPAYGERRDALDQRWTDFLDRCGLAPILVPNNADMLPHLLEVARIDGVILTGGGDLIEYGGNAPERDRTEAALLRVAMEQQLPVMGVCRGMQAIQHFFGVKLAAVSGHVAHQQTILINGESETVNSYHRFGSPATVPDLEVWAVADDGVVKAIRHRHRAIQGVMWHPERCTPFRDTDIRLFRQLFAAR